MFFGNYSTYEGEPARLYRSPDMIRKDILEIKHKIKSVDSQLNIRAVLSSIMDEYNGCEPERLIATLSDVVADAEATLDSLKHLRECLDILTEELEDTKWIMNARSG